MFAQCRCVHQFQDARYGKGNRVVNPLKKAERGPQQYRCTVCGTIHERLIEVARPVEPVPSK